MSTTAALTSVLFLLASLFLTLAAAAAAESSQPSPPSACAEELVRFSQCLSYVASPPNNLTDSPSSKCCDSFSSAVESGRAICLCYLLRNPPMFGFPVTEARVLSLSSLCPFQNSTAAYGSTSLQSLCSESSELPPLRNTTIPVISGAPATHGPEAASSPSMSTTPKPTNSSVRTASEAAHNSSTQPSLLTPPTSAMEPARVSPPSSTSGENRILKNNTSWILVVALLILLL